VLIIITFSLPPQDRANCVEKVIRIIFFQEWYPLCILLLICAIIFVCFQWRSSVKFLKRENDYLKDELNKFQGSIDQRG